MVALDGGIVRRTPAGTNEQGGNKQDSANRSHEVMVETLRAERQGVGQPVRSSESGEDLIQRFELVAGGG